MSFARSEKKNPTEEKTNRILRIYVYVSTAHLSLPAGLANGRLLPLPLDHPHADEDVDARAAAGVGPHALVGAGVIGAGAL